MAAANQALGSDDEEDSVAVSRNYLCQSRFMQHQRRFMPIALDDEASLKQCKGNWPHQVLISRESFDIIQDIQARIAALPIKITWKWVKGHQDDNAFYGALDWWALPYQYLC